jgi:hypothetical protein
MISNAPTPQELATRPRAERNRAIIEMASASAFDFIDFGTHKGSGLAFGSQILGGSRGMGVELNEAKVIENLAAGRYVYSGNVNSIPVEGKCFSFGVCRHVLEHMPDPETVGAVLGSLGRMCRDYIYIEQPDATHEGYLNSLGLMSMSATLSYHTCLMTDQEISETLMKQGLNDFVIGHLLPQMDSDNQWIQALGAPPDRWTWNEKDPPKPKVKFDRPIYRDIVFVVRLNKQLDIRSVVDRIPRIVLRQ